LRPPLFYVRGYRVPTACRLRGKRKYNHAAWLIRRLPIALQPKVRLCEADHVQRLLRQAIAAIGRVVFVVFVAFTATHWCALALTAAQGRGLQLLTLQTPQLPWETLVVLPLSWWLPRGSFQPKTRNWTWTKKNTNVGGGSTLNLLRSVMARSDVARANAIDSFQCDAGRVDHAGQRG
jgi:hypothetical protein